MFIKLLGSPLLTDDNGVSHPLKPAEALTLAYLSLTPKSDRKYLARLIWPHASDNKAQHSLNQLLYSLRRRYKLLLPSEQRLVRAVGVTNDVALLRADLDDGRYVDALTRVAGRFLEDVPVPRGDATAWRDEVDSQVTALVKSAVTAGLGSALKDELPRVVALCERLLVHFPFLHEERAQLIEAVLKTGDTTRAQRMHGELQAAVESDEPLPTFDALLAATSHCSPVTDPHEHGGLSLKFVGREGELRSLIETWRQVEAGEGATCAITGESGIGKTRICTHFLRRVAIGGGRTWVARCSASSQRLPFSAIRSLLEDAGVDPTTARPEIAFVVSPITSSYRPDVTSEYLTHVLVEALTNLIVTQAAHKPIAILVDDAQWADDFTAMLLSYWSYRLRSDRVLILVAVRTHDVGAVPHWLQSELTGVRTIPLEPLSYTESAELLNQFERTTATELTVERKAALLDKCGGVPFLLIDQLNVEGSLQCDSSNITTSAHDALSSRFQQLPPECLWLVGFLAVIGEAISSSELAQLAGVKDVETAAAIDLLQSRGIVRCESGRLEFPHDLMRDVAYRNLGSGTRSMLHNRVGALLSSREGREGSAAQHYAAAGAAEQCSSFALIAAETALQKQLYRDAEFYYRLILSKGSPSYSALAAQQLLRLLLQVGRIADGQDLLPLIPASVGDPSVGMLEAVATLEQELVRGATSTDLLERAKAVARMTDAIRAAGLATVGTSLLDVAMDASAIELGREVVNELVEAADYEVDPEFALQTQALAAIWEAVTESHARAQTRLNQLPKYSVHDLSTPTRGLIGSAAALAAFYSGNLLGALEIYEESITHAERAGDTRRLYVLRANWAVACMELGRMDDARRGFEMAATAPKLPYRMRAYQNLSLLHYEQSDYVLAQHAADAILSQNNVYKAPALEASARAVHGLCALANGDLDRACENLNAIQRTNVDPTVALNDNSYILTFLARMRCNANDVSGAVAMLQQGVAAKQSIDVLSALRLECEAARIIATYNPDSAYAMGRRVLNQAQQYNAHLIGERAKQVLAICRLSS
jgi:DNA-binding SARP family transcriptional activator/tetratricopeptide (TPR) repeat protein